MVHEVYLVIGGSGFVGRHIVEALLRRKDVVSVLDIVQRHHDVPFYSADISEQSQVEDALRKSSATCIIHTASPPHGLDPAVYWRVNVEGTKAVIAAAVAVGVHKLVFTSSAGVVFNGLDIIGVDERLPFPENALDAYNESKAKAEELVLAANGKGGLLTVALRPAGIFGPGDRQVMHGLTQVYNNKQTHWQIGDNTNLFDWTYVSNVALAHLLAADKLAPQQEVLKDSDSILKPLGPIDLTTGSRRVPTSAARPLGPAVEPVKNGDALEKAFASAESIEPRPVLRSRFDPLSEEALKDDENNPLRVDGQVFFITNGEPVYFWDFARAVWRELGEPQNTPRTVLPRTVGLTLATLAEAWAWLVGKEPTFTRFRVTFSCTTRWHNIEKARRVLGYEPEVGVMEGVKRMVDWYKSEHMKS